MTDITWSLLIQILSFIVFFLLFRRIFFTPVLRVMEGREARITELMEEAENRREQAVEIEERYSARLQEARNEAEQIIRRGEQQARKQYEEILAEARQETDQMLSEARRQIEEERNRALVDFESEAVELACDIASRVLQRPLEEEERADMQAEVLEAVRERID